MGSLHNIDFGVFWASWGGSGKGTGFRGSEGGSRFPWGSKVSGFVGVPNLPSWGLRLDARWQCCAESECHLCKKGLLRLLAVGDTTYAYCFECHVIQEKCILDQSKKCIPIKQI